MTFDILHDEEDDGVQRLHIERQDTIEQYLFRLDDGDLLYQGPMNNGDGWTWDEIPDDAREFAEDHFGAELAGDTDDLKEIRDSMEA
jgi:hypothetical protein